VGEIADELAEGKPLYAWANAAGIPYFGYGAGVVSASPDQEGPVIANIATTEFNAYQVWKKDGWPYSMSDVWPARGTYNWAPIDDRLRAGAPLVALSSPIFNGWWCPTPGEYCTTVNQFVVPAWIREPDPAKNPGAAAKVPGPALQQEMQKFLKAFVKRYANGVPSLGIPKIAAFQLANELVTPGNDWWYRAISGTAPVSSYICRLAQWAHDADRAWPIQAFVSDYSNDHGLWQPVGSPDRNQNAVDFYNAVLPARACSATVTANCCPRGLDGVGFQTHHRLHEPKWWTNGQFDQDKYFDDVARTIRMYADAGLDIYLTEGGVRIDPAPEFEGTGVLDPVTGQLTSSEASAQEQMFYQMMRAFRTGALPTAVPGRPLEPSRLEYVSMWGITDLIRTAPDGSQQAFCFDPNGCLWDKNLNPKPAYTGVYRGLTVSVTR
jgi:GH35 family endo-1,4-beta-xylanase